MAFDWFVDVNYLIFLSKNDFCTGQRVVSRPPRPIARMAPGHPHSLQVLKDIKNGRKKKPLSDCCRKMARDEVYLCVCLAQTTIQIEDLQPFAVSFL